MKSFCGLLLILVLTGSMGCKKVHMVVIQNPATGSREQPYKLDPGERFSILISQHADPSSFRVRVFPAVDGDDACPYYGGPEITTLFKPQPFSAGSAVAAVPPERLSICGPFKLWAEADPGPTAPAGMEVIRSAEIWFDAYDLEMTPTENPLHLGVNESRDIRIVFASRAVDSFTAVADLSGDDDPVAMVNNQYDKARLTVGEGARELYFPVKGIKEGQCFLWIHLPGGPALSKTIVIE